MSVQYAYDLCDAIEYFLSSCGTIPSHAQFVYLGSYFCDHYFCGIPDNVWQMCFQRIQDYGASAVLVIPTPSQRQLPTIKQRVLTLMDTYCGQIKDIVVNDPGMVTWFTSVYPKKNLWLGRTMDKELRDPRYPFPKMHKKLWEQADDDRFAGVEIDISSFDSTQIPASGCRLGIHTSLVYLTMGRICEFAAIGLPTTEKFQLYRSCNRQCVSNWLREELGEYVFLKHGRAVYTPASNKPTLPPEANVRLIESILVKKSMSSHRGGDIYEPISSDHRSETHFISAAMLE